MLDIVETHAGYEVSFAYKPWLINAIKQIPGARFRTSGDKKYWFVPEHSGPALLNWAKNFSNISVKNKTIEVGELPALPELTMNIPLKMNVFNYQKNVVAYGMEKKRIINGDDMGLGKTAQSIATIIGLKAKCTLVICPATLKENWKREYRMWTGEEAIILTNRTKNTWHQYYKVGMCRFFICNYESLKKYFVNEIEKHYDKNGDPMPLRLNHIKFNETIDLFDSIIIDELHRTKDGSRQLSKFCMGLTKGKEIILGLTGTPVVNKPKDLISQLHIINRLSDLGGYKAFVDRYCQGFNEASNLKELNYMLHKTCFFRRLKKEVLSDLPDKLRSIFKVEITNQQEYDKAENNLIAYLRENLKKTDGEITTALRGQAMVLIGILKRISAVGKIEATLEHIQEVVDAGEKIVVFAWHKEVVYELKRQLPGSVTIVGDDSLQQRQHSVDSFQNNPDTKIIICNIQSGGVGITLTASSRVAFIELPWHPAHADQAEDRTWRIGQKNSVQCTYLLGDNTIDEYIYSIIEKKRAIVGEVTGAENEIETNVVDEFINLFKEKL
jgi:SWI/SNF-related matrix-associated actin-dependent regulator 1 of chromatin subfamily A